MRALIELLCDVYGPGDETRSPGPPPIDRTSLQRSASTWTTQRFKLYTGREFPARYEYTRQELGIITGDSHACRLRDVPGHVQARRERKKRKREL